MLYDRDSEDSDWSLFDSIMLAFFILLGVVVGVSVTLMVMM